MGSTTPPSAIEIEEANRVKAKQAANALKQKAALDALQTDAIFKQMPAELSFAYVKKNDDE